MGSSQIFEEKLINTTKPLDSNKLYLANRESQTPLELLPIFKMMPVPETEEIACYFYSKIASSDEIRYVSYHYSSAPERFDKDTRMAEFIRGF